MTNRFIACILMVLLIPSLPSAVQEEAPKFPVGQIVDPVIAQESAGQSYALYLPKSYTPEKKWPILYCFDPRQRGKLAAELFRPAAEKYGYILASSNNSRSDDPTAPNTQAIRAMWQHTHESFSIDERRAYGTGFSGGSRVACDMGYMYPGEVAGVIGVGAGFPIDKRPSPDTPFLFFGAIGDKDFNFYELRLLEVALTNAGLPHLIEVFDGGHQWPPQSLATEGVEWMEVRAMKDGKKEVDQSLVQELYEKRMQKGQRLEAEGKPYRAFKNYKQALDDFGGLVAELQPLQTRVQSLEKSEAVRKFIQDQARRDAEDAAYRKKFSTVLQAMRGSGDAPLNGEKIREELELKSLLKKARDPSDLEEQLSAQRKLEVIFVNVSFYLPHLYMQREQYDRAIVVLTIGSEIKPDSPHIWYDLGRAYSMHGDQKNALKSLSKAVEKGYNDVETLQSDIDLKGVREEKGFKELLKKMEKKSSPS